VERNNRYCLIGLVKMDLNCIIFEEDGIEHLNFSDLRFMSSGSAMWEYRVLCM